MNAVILSRLLIQSAPSKERRSTIDNDPIPRLNGVFGPISEAKSGDQLLQHSVADKRGADQVRIATLMAIVLRV
jgi:hypothetical protein